MRRLLLLAALCMALALVLAAPAMAQSASADPCPDPEFPRETPDGCQASDLPDVVGGGSPVATPDSSASSSASAAPSEGEPISLGSETEPCPIDLAEVQAEYGPDVVCAEGGGYAYGSAGATATAESDDEGSATASASASASASATALPETGGPNPAAFALPSLALLVAGGIFAARLVRR